MAAAPFAANQGVLRRIRTSLTVVTAALLAVGCAGRSPQLVQTVQPQDRSMECSAITAEVQSNNSQITTLSGEEGQKVAQNVVAGVAGVFIPVLWLAMDFQNSAGKEVKALEQRNQYLATIAAERCNRPATTTTTQLRTY